MACGNDGVVGVIGIFSNHGHHSSKAGGGTVMSDPSDTIKARLIYERGIP